MVGEWHWPKDRVEFVSGLSKGVFRVFGLQEEEDLISRGVCMAAVCCWLKLLILQSGRPDGADIIATAAMHSLGLPSESARQGQASSGSSP